MAQARSNTKGATTSAQEDTVQDIRTELDKAGVEPAKQEAAAVGAEELAAAGNLSEADVAAIAARVVSKFNLAEVEAAGEDEQLATKARTQSVTLTREVGGHKEGDTITVTSGAADYLREQGYAGIDDED